MTISSLIDRKNAIEAMKNYCKTECYYNDLDWCPECQLDELIKVIEGLPVQKKTWIELHDYFNGNLVMVRVEQINFFTRNELINPNCTLLSFGDNSIYVRESPEEICKMIGCEQDVTEKSD